jgi:hypothetical protein
MPRRIHRPDGHRRHAEQERHPPSPAVELCGRQGGHQGEGAVGQHQPGRGAPLRPAGREAALPLVGPLGGQQGRAGPLAAHAHALQHPSQRQEHPAPDADAVVARAEADQGGGGAHEEQGGDQRGLASHPVAQVAEQGGAHRAGHEAHEVGGEGEQRPGVRVTAGEEDAREDQGGGDAVEEEVVPLHRRADRRRHHRAAHLPAIGRLAADGLRAVLTDGGDAGRRLLTTWGWSGARHRLNLRLTSRRMRR